MSQSILLSAEAAQEILEHLSDFHAGLDSESPQAEEIDRACGFLQPNDALITESSLEPSVMIRVNWFKQPDFLAWANAARLRGLASWGHDGHSIDGYPDIFIAVDPSLNGEGSDSDMPEHYWEAVMAAVRQHVRPQATKEHIVVRLAPAI